MAVEPLLIFHSLTRIQHLEVEKEGVLDVVVVVAAVVVDIAEGVGEVKTVQSQLTTSKLWQNST